MVDARIAGSGRWAEERLDGLLIQETLQDFQNYLQKKGEAEFFRVNEYDDATKDYRENPLLKQLWDEGERAKFLEQIKIFNDRLHKLNQLFSDYYVTFAALPALSELESHRAKIARIVEEAPRPLLQIKKTI